jgi:hypothetical protein
MTGGRDPDDEESSDDSRTARILMVAVLALAVAATAVLVLSDSARWLRLGVLAALWAALLGVFLASRFRKAMADRENEVADLQSVYELELEREMAARREFEQEVEAAARQKVEAANREDLAELKAELRLLRENLERLNGGEVLVERFALRAQSTRMRSLAEGQPRVVAASADDPRARRSIAAPADSTDLIPRADAPAAPSARRPQQRPAAYRPEPSRPQTLREGSAPGEPGGDRREAQPVAAQPTRVARPVQPRQVPRTARVPEPQQQAWPSPAAAAAVLRPAATQRPTAQRPTQAPQPQRRQPPARQPAPAPTPGDVGMSARLEGRAATRPEPTGGHRRAPEQTQRAEPVGGSRHSADPPVVTPVPLAESTGGRRRAAEEAPKDWQEYREWRHEVDAAAEVAPDPDTTGAHAAGKSVTELLAAHGNQEDDAPRRHRRRAE